MKSTLANTPCWVLSSHGHPCEAEIATETATRARRSAVSRPRRHSCRPDQRDAYWMQAGTQPEGPVAKRLGAR